MRALIVQVLFHDFSNVSEEEVAPGVVKSVEKTKCGMGFVKLFF